MLHVLHQAALDFDQSRALGAGFAPMASLQVPRKDDPRGGGEHFALMHVTERPVVVTFAHEVLDAARGVGFVPGATAH